MKNPALTKEFVDSVLDIHSDGTCLWKNVSKFHREKSGTIAGFAKLSNAGKRYWVIKIGRVPYKRAYLVFVSATGKWPDLLDHINGDSCDDRISNLREATITENSWNHRTRKKKSPLPMGVRQASSGKFEARIAHNKKQIHLGSFSTIHEAFVAYQSKRKELFGEYSGL